MGRDKLVPYWARLRPLKESGHNVQESDYFNLTDLSSENEGFEDYDLFAEFILEKLEFLQNHGYKNDENDKTLTVRQLGYANPGDSLSTPSGYTIEAQFGYGRFGRSTDHLETDDVGTLAADLSDLREEDARDRKTSAEDRLYFLYHQSDLDPTKAIMVFHKYGNRGTKTTFKRFLNEELQGLFTKTNLPDGKGLKFEMNTIASKELSEQLLEDRLNGIEVIQRKVSTEAYGEESDILGNTTDAKISLSIESDEFSLDKQGIQNLLSRVGRNDYPFAEIIESTNEGDPVDKINALVETTDGRNRKRDLTRSELTMEAYISEDLDYDEETNRPTVSSIGMEARNFINDQLEVYQNEKLSIDDSLLNDESGQSPDQLDQFASRE